MASNDDAYIYAEPVNSNSSNSLKLSKFPVTKSVRDLKAAIAEQVGAGCNAEYITVAFGSEELKDEDKSLSEYKIRNGDVVDFLHFTVEELDQALDSISEETLTLSGSEVEEISEMFIRDVTKSGAQKAVTSVPADATIADFRKILAKQHGQQYQDDLSYRFLWKGKQLKDDDKLLDYGTQKELENCTIDIVSRTRGGHSLVR